MRKVAILATAVVVGLVVLGAAFLLLVDANQFRGTIQNELETRLHRTVKLGDMGLKFFPLAVRVEKVEIGEAPEFASRLPFVTAEEMYVRVGLGALLKKRIEVDSFRLKRPTVELIRNRAGKWNAATLGAEKSGGEGPPLTLTEFAIEDGRLAVTDLQLGKPRAVYDHIDVRVRDFAPGKRFSLESSVRLPGQEKLALAIAGAGTLTEKTLAFESLTAKLGGLAMKGHGEAKLGQDPAAISADFRAESIAVTELAKLAAALGADSGLTGSGALSLGAKIEGPANALSIAVSSTIRSASLKTPALEKPLEIKSAELRLKLAATGNGAGTLTADSLTLKEFTLTDLKAACRIEGGVVRLDPVSARAFGGSQTGSITVDLRGRQPVYAVQMKMNQVDAEQLLAATTPVRKVVFGSLFGDSDLRIAAAPGQDMVRGLNGDVRIQLNNGKLAGVSLMNELASLAQLIGYAKKQESFTDFVRLSGTLHLVNGVANTDDLALEIAGGTIGAAGQVGLPDQTLNLRVTAVLGKELSQQWTGGRLGGLMSTVLANKNGELVIPAIVTGTFSKPAFAPDAARVAKMKLDGLLPSKDGAKGMIGGVMGAITGKKDDAGQEKKPLRGIFDAIRGRKSANEPQQK